MNVRHRILAFVLLSLVSTKAMAGIPVEGRVLGPDGKGLAGARVEVRPILRVHEQGVRELEGRSGPDPVGRTATGMDGWYRIEVPHEGVWSVVITAPGMIPMEGRMAVTGERSFPPLPMAQDDGLLVRVEGAGGQPVAGARIAVQTGSRSPWSSAWLPARRAGVSGADGTLRLPRSGKETLRLSALAPGYAPGRADEVDRSSLTLRLPPGRRWTLRTYADKEFMADALVRDAASLLPIGRTDTKGVLLMDAPSAGPWKLRVDTRDGRLAPFEVPEIPKTFPREHPRILIVPPLVPLSGRVVDQLDRKPLTGALIWPGEDPGAFVLTDTSGAYRLGGTSRTRVGLQAEREGYLAGLEVFTVADEPGPAPSLALQPSGGLAGIAVDSNGQPVSGAEIRVFLLEDSGTLEVSRVRSSIQGRFRISGLSRGVSYQLLAAAPGLSPAREGVTLGEKTKERSGLRLVLEPGRSARGRVVDPFGQPVAGAQVELVRSFAAEIHPDAPLPALAEISVDDGLYRAGTREDGRFEIAGLPAGWFDLEVRLPGFVTLALPGVEVGEEPDLGVFTLQPGVTLEGRVVGPEGEPIGEAEVWIVTDGMGERAARKVRESGPAAVTGPDGRFILSGLNPADRPGLEICRQDRVTTSLRPDDGPVQGPVEITLQPAARLSGRVVDSDGEPVADAKVSAWTVPADPFEILQSPSTPCPTAGIRRQFDTDAEGRFTLESLRGGTFALRAVAEGYLLQSEPVEWQAKPGQDNDGPTLILERGALLAGLVLTSDGAPVAGAWVSTSGGSSRGHTNGDGVYRLLGIEPGEHTVWAGHPDLGLANLKVEVRPGENRLDLTLGPEERRELRGRVVGPDGEPVSGALVEARPDYGFVYSAADGSFVLRTVPQEGFELVAQKPGYSLARLDDWSVAGAAEGLELRLGRLSGLSGRILGVAPEDLPEVRVWAGDLLLERPGFVDREGTYRILGIEPGEWQVTAQLGSRSDTARVVIQPEESATLDLTLPLMVEVEGRVVGEQGEPVGEASVILRSAAGDASGYSQEDGSFSIEAKAGTYTLLAQKHNHVARYEEPLTVAGSPVEGLEIRMALGASISGRILGLSPEALPRTRISVEGSSSGRVEKDGTYRIGSLGPGEWQVSARSGLDTVARKVTILPGQEEVELDLLFSPGDLTLSVQVVAYRSVEALQICLERLGEPASASCVDPDTDGASFVFQELRPGPYLLAMTDDFARPVYRQEIDLSTDLELVIPIGKQP